MPLHHWPNARVPWRSFHNHWIVRLVEYLNADVLPSGFQARPTELIIGIEPDLLRLQDSDQPETDRQISSQSTLGEATTTAVLPPPAERPMVGIYSAYDTNRIVAVIELVSPGNKDGPEAVKHFVEKALFLLQEGVHVMVIDVIRLPRQAMRRPILKRLGLNDEGDSHQIWVSSYCSLPDSEPQPHLKVREWAHTVDVNASLPDLPLFLRTDQQWVMVDLESTYQATLQAGRYDPA
ncbi:DUF4058 family protein [Candidatus Entotheonella palauensis]|uniref:DUF4058 domain-containing protein n=1 Tax=Candidatus Entotheonella gemina TaxID=1429439 RepID=W4M3D4_9BACT|nr:DUF4058 family protein [Candidatus Entotheonella palauensis]ETX04157.1 MAG: hypothetical protein ETSY2_30415 [Candidatus Entotheonella gemina]